MGEGRRDRSSRRHRVNLIIEKSSSDTEIGRSVGKNRKNRSRKKQGRWPFVEGLTVDELGRYRRRRVENCPKDTLGTRENNFDVEEAPSTEYRRAFRATSENSILNARDDTSREIIAGATKDIDETIVVDVESQLGVEKLSTTDEVSVMETGVEKSRHYEESGNVAITRPPLMRRGTSLRREGDEFYGNTEYSSYVSHPGNHRAELARRPTSLKLEGNMTGTTSEQCDKFVEWLNVTRPELARLPTNLKLEGDIETTTENHDKYVPFVGARRPELLRQTAHLRLEGQSTFVPEYTDVFRDHHVRDKRMPHFPANHLKSSGDFCEKTESSMAYGDPKNNESLRERQREDDRSTVDNQQKNNDQDMRILVSQMEDLKGSPRNVAEYTDAYKDFPRERPKLMKPEDEIGRSDGSKVHPSPGSHAKFQTKIDRDLEYKSKFIDDDRAVYRKPPLALRRPSAVVSSSLDERTAREFRRHEATSEVRSQYVPYGRVPRVGTVRMPANLRLEGSIDLHPEYRDAYCGRRETQAIDEQPRAHRRRDRSLSETRRRDDNCHWMNNNNSEHFGQINAANDQDAFQLVTTKVHEDSIVGKPPPGSRRAGRLDVTSPIGISMRNRSTSPSYRLQVCNVDDAEPRSFAHRTRRSPSFERDQRAQDPSPGFHGHHRHHHHQRDPVQRPYSPSFGTNQHRNPSADQQAFVVLNNTSSNNLPFNPIVIGDRSRKLNDRNCNSIVGKSGRGRSRNRTPTNWMPPWYDNTSAI